MEMEMVHHDGDGDGGGSKVIEGEGGWGKCGSPTNSHRKKVSSAYAERICEGHGAHLGMLRIAMGRRPPPHPNCEPHAATRKEMRTPVCETLDLPARFSRFLHSETQS